MHSDHIEYLQINEHSCGNTLIFPSSLPHSVAMKTTDGERISVSGNIVFDRWVQCKEILYNSNSSLHKTMTVTTNEFGQQNMFAKEPQMYIDKTEAERYGYETYAERAEKLNGRTQRCSVL